MTNHAWEGIDGKEHVCTKRPRHDEHLCACGRADTRIEAWNSLTHNGNGKEVPRG